MDSVQIANLFGFLAAALGIVMFIPQTVQVWKTKNTKGISLVSFALFDIASLFWTVYGVLLHATPVIMVNVVLLVLNTYIVLMKLKYK